MLTDDYAAWPPTKVNTGASFNLLQAPSEQAFPAAGARSGSPGRWQGRLSFRAHLLAPEPAIPANGLPPPVRPSGVRASAKGTGDNRGRGRDGEGDQPHVVLPTHPASLPSCLYCGPKNRRPRHSGRLRSRPGRSGAFQPEEELARPRDGPARCSSRFACSARGRTAPRGLKGKGAKGGPYWGP